MFFNLNVEDFFEIQDYLTSSIDIIIITTTTSFIIGVITSLIGINTVINRGLNADQFGLKIKKDALDYYFIVLTIVSFIGLPVYYIITNTLYKPYLETVIIVIVIYFLAKCPLLNYIQNRLHVIVAILSLTFFSISIYYSLDNNINSLKSGNYLSPYELRLKNEYLIYSDNKYISSNSNYIFLWDQKTKKINVTPKSALVSIQVK